MLKMKLNVACFMILLLTPSSIAKKEKKQNKHGSSSIAYATGDLNVAGCLVNLNGNYYDLSPLKLG
jgi:hypothetical protein